MLGALVQATIVRLLAAAVTTAVATLILARLSMRHGEGRWPALSALVLGQEEDDPAPGHDLRFAAVVTAVVSALAWVVALDARFRELGGATRALVLATGLPLTAVIVAAAADLLARERAAAAPAPAIDEDDSADAVLDLPAATVVPEVKPVADEVEVSSPAEPTRPAPVAAEPGPPLDTSKLRRPSSTTRDEVRTLIEGALGEVGAARARTEELAVREALASLEETLAEYSKLVDDEDAELDRIAQRVREAAALAQACDDDVAGCFRLLGLRRDATPDQARRVYRDLAKIYHSDTAAPGVDPEKFKEITAAYEKVRGTITATPVASPVEPKASAA